MGLLNIILAIYLTVAITIIVLISTVPVASNSKTQTQMQPQTETQTPITMKPHRVSRFLAQNGKKSRNANAGDHCKKNNELCEGPRTPNSIMACCGNKCVDVAYDDDKCGACENTCKFSQTCCRGECVYLAFDKRHCGACNRGCLGDDKFCSFGLCSYA